MNLNIFNFLPQTSFSYSIPKANRVSHLHLHDRGMGFKSRPGSGPPGTRSDLAADCRGAGLSDSEHMVSGSRFKKPCPRDKPHPSLHNGFPRRRPSRGQSTGTCAYNLLHFIHPAAPTSGAIKLICSHPTGAGHLLLQNIICSSFAVCCDAMS